jgi:prepilin-type N-terminal cleavage/methylation domain-containing protein
MVRRGFTLIELLAVVAILLVVTAVSLPAVEGRLAGARFEAAVQRVDAELAWARAEAQRRGEASRVEAREGVNGWGLFLTGLEKQEPRTDAAGRRGEKTAAEQPFAEFDAGLSFTDQRPAADEAAPVKEQVPGPVAVCVFLPDGSAMASGPVYMVGFDRAVSLAVNHWTGGVAVTVVDLTAKPEEQQAEEKKPVRKSGNREGKT